MSLPMVVEFLPGTDGRLRKIFCLTNFLTLRGGMSKFSTMI